MEAVDYGTEEIMLHPSYSDLMKVVNADVEGQGYEATKAETDRNIEIK